MTMCTARPCTGSAGEQLYDGPMPISWLTSGISIGIDTIKKDSKAAKLPKETFPHPAYEKYYDPSGRN